MQYVRHSFGIDLSESKRARLQIEMANLLAASDCTSLSEFLAELDAGGEHHEALANIVTTNVTSFFREAHHFELLEETVIPKLKQKAQQGDRIRVWSAGCSSGQEPYSIAMTFLKAWPELVRFDVKLLATDLDKAVLSKAELGRYSTGAFEEIPQRYQGFWQARDGSVEATSQMKSFMRFRRLNLMDAWPFSGRFDVVFCRNVAIYFSQSVRDRLWRRISDVVEPDGYLFVGHSERVANNEEAGFQPCGVTCYQKTTNHTHD